MGPQAMPRTLQTSHELQHMNEQLRGELTTFGDALKNQTLANDMSAM